MIYQHDLWHYHPDSWSLASDAGSVTRQTQNFSFASLNREVTNTLNHLKVKKFLFSFSSLISFHFLCCAHLYLWHLLRTCVYGCTADRKLYLITSFRLKSAWQRESKFSQCSHWFHTDLHNPHNNQGLWKLPDPKLGSIIYLHTFWTKGFSKKENSSLEIISLYVSTQWFCFRFCLFWGNKIWHPLSKLGCL